MNISYFIFNLLDIIIKLGSDYMKFSTRINVSFSFFVILGAMNGAIVSLISSFFLDYLVTSYSTSCTLTYLDFLAVTTPCFACIGALFNVASAVFLYDEDTKKPKKRFFRKK